MLIVRNRPRQTPFIVKTARKFPAWSGSLDTITIHSLFLMTRSNNVLIVFICKLCMILHISKAKPTVFEDRVPER
ncbi:hypothetical protein NECAME_07988 [Necator americanus]|uniref:Uncharacterized protein n=1 Tax=Necator americanus TaxID=51031 RepID=W2TMP6_NECAM|nr:hypothetical protein NECAME_07988 [Necator americanus]ETN82411.1 hypothetical protein NECAME_07988 [Necator americanus]